MCHLHLCIGGNPTSFRHRFGGLGPLIPRFLQQVMHSMHDQQKLLETRAFGGKGVHAQRSVCGPLWRKSWICTCTRLLNSLCICLLCRWHWHSDRIWSLTPRQQHCNVTDIYFRLSDAIPTTFAPWQRNGNRKRRREEWRWRWQAGTTTHSEEPFSLMTQKWSTTWFMAWRHLEKSKAQQNHLETTMIPREPVLTPSLLFSSTAFPSCFW